MSILKDIKLFQSWKRTEGFLLQAKLFVLANALNKDQTKAMKYFDEFIEHNELGLAYDQLIFLTETVTVQKDFWTVMLSAAKEMKLEDEIKRCESFLRQ